MDTPNNNHNGSEWHSIRPWTPPITLQVKEITSVSATFILSSSVSSNSTNSKLPSRCLESDEHEHRLDPLGLIADHREENGGGIHSDAHPDSGGEGGAEGEEDSDSDSDSSTSSPTTLNDANTLVVSTALAQGLSVNVNGLLWKRVLIRIDDKADEAVIIIYGLMPGRQYDIDLGLVGGSDAGQGQGISLRRLVVTESASLCLCHLLLLLILCIRAYCIIWKDSDHPTSPTSSPNTPSSTSSDHHHHVSSTQSLTTSTGHPAAHFPLPLPLPTSPQSPTSCPCSHPHPHGTTHSHSNINAQTPTPHILTMTIEERTTQLQTLLSQLNTDRTSLSTSLKSARRDAQKADSSLRAQLEVFKRSSEKHAQSEHRSRQKILALQEAIKQASAASAELDVLAKEADEGLGGLIEERGKREGVYERVKEEADKVRGERERVEGEGRRKIEKAMGELGALGIRLERLAGKREKLEGVGEEGGEGGGGLVGELEEELRAVKMEIESIEQEEDGEDEGAEYIPTQRSRQSQSLEHTSRSSVAPIQRPTSGSHIHTVSNPPQSTTTATTTNTTPPARPHRNSLDPPFAFQHPFHAHPAAHFQSHSQSQSQSVKSPAHIFSSSTTTSPRPSSSATLSTKAPAFEPGRGPSHATRASFPGFGFGFGFAGGGTGGNGGSGVFQWPVPGASGSGSGEVSGMGSQSQRKVGTMWNDGSRDASK